MFVFALLRLAAVTAEDAADPAVLRREVETGKRKKARASWWGIKPDDATECLQAAMDSGAAKVVVDNVGHDWIVSSMRVPSDIELVFADGVVVRAKKGEFKKRRDPLFDINGQSNVILRGEGRVVFSMNKADYQDRSRYIPGCRHAVNIHNSQNVLVKNLTLKSSGGDGVYVGYFPKGQVCRDITLEGLVCDDNYRQGISVTGAENLLMKDCKFVNTRGTAPQCGVDYEPNYAKNSLANCVAVNCDFDGNAARGVSINCAHLDATSKPISIAFRNCRFRGNRDGILLVNTGTGTPSAPGKIEFTDCVISDHPTYSVAIAEHRVANLELAFRNCVIDNRKARSEAVRISSGRTEHIAGLRIEGLTVIDDDPKRPPIKFISRFSNGLVDAVVRDVTVRNSAGVERAFDCAEFLKNSAPPPPDKQFRTRPLDLRKLRPISSKGKAAGRGLRLRKKCDYLLWAKAGDQIRIAFANKPVHRFNHRFYRDPLKAVVWCPSVTDIDRFGIPFDGRTEYTLNAQETGIYRFEIDARMQTVTIEADAPGQGLSAAETLYVFGCRGRLYFHVPAGAKEFQIEAGGSPREASTVSLLDADGKPVDEGINLEGSKLLKATRPDGTKAETWSLKFGASKLFLRLGAPLVPILSPDPANILVETAN